MEQEEALKASETATKRLINNRFTPIHRLQWLDLLHPDINELWCRWMLNRLHIQVHLSL
jgi:hypothetical protein